MNLTALIDVTIGLSLMYLVASLFVTVANEFIAQSLRMRGRDLAKQFTKLIDEPNLREKLKNGSPALKALLDSDGKVGSYVDPNVLAQVLAGALGAGAQGLAAMDDILKGITALPDSSIKQQLEAIAKTGPDKVERFVERVSTWADRSLTMLGEGYKQNLQVISFVIGFVIAGVFNLDTLTLTSRLYQDSELREATVAVAIELTEKTSKGTFDKCMSMETEARANAEECKPLTGLVDGVLKRNETLGKLPIGWGTVNLKENGLWAWIFRVIGWLLTALAVSLGAPFWFDLLNRVISVRHGMRRPEVIKPESA